MNDSMGIRRSCEEGKYLLRDGDCLWRVNEEGIVDCTAHGDSRIFDLLTSLQQWKSPSRRFFLNYPLQNPLSD